ncbi:Uncharacterised protein g2331 [Pycnogonum litorale]
MSIVFSPNLTDFRIHDGFDTHAVPNTPVFLYKSRTAVTPQAVPSVILSRSVYLTPLSSITFQQVPEKAGITPTSNVIIKKGTPSQWVQHSMNNKRTLLDVTEQEDITFQQVQDKTGSPSLLDIIDREAEASEHCLTLLDICELEDLQEVPKTPETKHTQAQMGSNATFKDSDEEIQILIPDLFTYASGKCDYDKD